jgi:hypothetical protein
MDKGKKISFEGGGLISEILHNFRLETPFKNWNTIVKNFF